MQDTWQTIAQQLASGQSVVLAVVVSHRGSAPGKRGFKMVIGQDGALDGTIGGGKMEYDLVSLAREMIASSARKPSLLNRVHRARGPAEERSGMICAGSQQLVLQPLEPGDRGLVDQIARALAGGLPGFLEISSEGMTFRTGATAREPGFHQELEGWHYRERLGPRDILYIVGSGHVGLAVSRVMAGLDFHVVAFDHRAEVATVTANCFADEIKIMAYEEIGPHIAEGEHTYAVIVTTAYPSDVAALRQIVGKRMRYIGLMGSAAKLKKIFAELGAVGVRQEDLARIKAPIGVPIKNRTPAEIAVSIAAQIIDIRNG